MRCISDYILGSPRCGKLGAGRKARGGEILPILAVGWQASAVRGEEAGHFREVAGVSTVIRIPQSLLTVDSRVA